jgi:hypothetical protein
MSCINTFGFGLIDHAYIYILLEDVGTLGLTLREYSSGQRRSLGRISNAATAVFLDSRFPLVIKP